MSLGKLNSSMQSEQFLVFLLDEKNYGFPLLQIDGIISLSKITPMPKTPDFVKGVINVRGQIIPVIDIRLVFKMSEIEYDERTCIVLLKMKINNLEKLVGFVVDTVSEVFDIPLSEIEAPPECGVKMDDNYLSGIAKVKDKVVMLLNINNLINEYETGSFIGGSLNNVADLVTA